MEGGRPFDPDDLDFDFDSARRQRLERQSGERRSEPGPEADEPPAEEAPYDAEDAGYDTGESRPETGERRYETGETPYDTGQSGYGTGESGTGGYDTGEDPFDTGERRTRRERPRRRFRIGKRRPRREERRADRGAAATDTGERRLEDDPYTPAEVPVSGSRRSRHRDLPAKVRRRQAFLAGGVALVVLVLLVVAANAIFGGGGGDDDEPLPLKKLVGQSVIAKLGKDGPDRELLRRVRKGQIGGVIATAPTDPETLLQQVTQLQQAAADGDNPQLLVMIDQEGGDVQRLDGPPNVDPPDMGEAGADTARSEGEDTGNFLKGAGVNVDLAPVLDVEVPQTADTIANRTFGDDAAVVSEVGSAFIEGMQSTGIAATAKHFPGLGPATVNTDFAPAEVVARQETLDAALQPFQAAIDSGVRMVMVASASYEGYGPENPRDPNRPANSVKAITQNLLRDQMGFLGVIITDDLESIAIETLTSPSNAGVAALGAGCDLILYARSDGASEDAFNAVVKAAKQEKLSRDQLQGTYDRITALKSLLVTSDSGE